MPSFDAGSSLQEMRQNLPKSSGLSGKWFGGVAKADLIPELHPSGDPLDGFWDVQKQLLREGDLVWSAMIQANEDLFVPGDEIQPGEVVTSLDAVFDSQPEGLCRLATRIYKLKGTSPRDPKLRRVADRITDEMYRSLGDRIPNQLTDGREVFRYTVLFYPEHMPQRFLNERLLPLLVLPDCDHAMLLPHWYWSEAYLERWKPTLAQRLRFAELDSRKNAEPREPRSKANPPQKKSSRRVRERQRKKTFSTAVGYSWLILVGVLLFCLFLMMLTVFFQKAGDFVFISLAGMLVASCLGMVLGLVWAFCDAVRREKWNYIYWIVRNFGIPRMIHAYDLRYEKPIIFRLVWISFFSFALILGLGCATSIMASESY